MTRARTSFLWLPLAIAVLTHGPATAVPGDLDPSSGAAGRVVTPIGTEDGAMAYSVVVQPDGKLVAAGGTPIPNGRQFAVVRYDTDGTLDAAFGSGLPLFPTNCVAAKGGRTVSCK